MIPCPTTPSLWSGLSPPFPFPFPFHHRLLSCMQSNHRHQKLHFFPSLPFSPFSPLPSFLPPWLANTGLLLAVVHTFPLSPLLVSFFFPHHHQESGKTNLERIAVAFPGTARPKTPCLVFITRYLSHF
ncbi:hypothetical protein AA313_de0202911 [Arthrobotrys entomopaga]|nr:hypothetical protein AA313_de0202911 [Arthrobotrys entomopaga]